MARTTIAQPKHVTAVAYKVPGTSLGGTEELPEPMLAEEAKAHVRRKLGMTTIPMAWLVKEETENLLQFTARAGLWKAKHFLRPLKLTDGET